MPKVTLTDVSNLLGNPTSAANTINANNNLVEEALENTLSRDGTSPNQMESNLDMNHYDILNASSVATDTLLVDGVDISDILSEVAGASENAAIAAQAALDAQEAAAEAVAAAESIELPSDLSGNTVLVTNPLGTLREDITFPEFRERAYLSPWISPQTFGAVGNGANDDTAAWNSFIASTGALKYVPAGQYLVDGQIKRFDNYVVGNGEFDDDTAAWDQPTGDRERHAILVQRNDIDANSTLVSPVIKTQTHVDFVRDVPSGSFKHVVGAYHEATYDGYYNTQADTNQNFTVVGASMLNRMAGLFGGLALSLQAEDVDETVNPNISTMGASKNGCAFLRYTRNAKFADGGYGFGLEVYCQNTANESLDVPYQNNDNYFSSGWTTGIKVAVSSSGAPISSAMFTHGLTGKHGAWNGIVIGGSGFRINNDDQGVPGTVGLNFASWRAANGYGDIAIKFEKANRHLHFNEGAKIRSSLIRQIYDGGTAGYALESSGTNAAYIDFKNGATTSPDPSTTQLARITGGTNLTLNSVAGEVRLSPDNGSVVYSATSSEFSPDTGSNGTKSLGSSARRWLTGWMKNLVLSPGIGTTVTPANNGDLTFDIVSNTSVRVRLRGSDGVVRSATLTLS